MSYEHAYALLKPTRQSPHWSMAAFNLGHWLAGEDDPESWERAKRLLEDVRVHDRERRRQAVLDLLLLAFKREADAELGALARELEGLLRSTPPASPSDALDAWGWVATAAAIAGDVAAMEAALPEVEAHAAAIVRTGSQPEAELAVRVAGIYVTLASMFADTDRTRMQALARVARERLDAIPREKRPDELESAIQEFLAE